VKNVLFSSSKCVKENKLKHKNQVRKTFSLELGLRLWRIIRFINWCSNKRQTFTLISIKIMRIWKFFFTSNRVFKHKDVVSNLHVSSNGLGKMWPSYTLNFSKRILTSTHTKDLIFFLIMYVAMTNNQFSALNNVKMTCQTHK